MQLSVYTAGPDGNGFSRRHLAGPTVYAPTERPAHTTVELPCYCPKHRDGQPLHPERDQVAVPGGPAK